VPLAGEEQKCGLSFVARDGWHPFPHKVMCASSMIAICTPPEHRLHPRRPTSLRSYRAADWQSTHWYVLEHSRYRSPITVSRPRGHPRIGPGWDWSGELAEKTGRCHPIATSPSPFGDRVPDVLLPHRGISLIICLTTSEVHALQHEHRKPSNKFNLSCLDTQAQSSLVELH
jgi:hypothetical protein